MQRIALAGAFMLAFLVGIACADGQPAENSPVFDLVTAGWDAYQDGDLASAERSFRAALELARKGDPDSPDLGRALTSMGAIRFRQGAYDEAVSLTEEGYRILQASLGSENAEVAGIQQNLAGFYLAGGDIARAAPLMEGAVAMIEKIQGPRSPELALALAGLARCRHQQDRPDDAEPLYLRAVDIMEQALPGPNIYTLDILNNLGVLYEQQHRLDEAERVLRKAYALGVEGVGPGHPSVGGIVNNLGRVSHAAGHLSDAASSYRTSLTIKEQALGANHPDLVSTLDSLASIHQVLGDLDEALAFAERAVKIAEQSFPADHPRVEEALSGLASVRYSRAEYDLAAPLFDRSLELRLRRLGPDHPEVAMLLSSIGSLRRGQKHYAEALELQTRALKIFEADERTRPQMSQCLHRLANLYRDMGRTADAEDHYRRSLDLYEQTHGANHLLRVAVVKDYAAFLRGNGRAREAEDLVEGMLRTGTASLEP